MYSPAKRSTRRRRSTRATRYASSSSSSSVGSSTRSEDAFVDLESSTSATSSDSMATSTVSNSTASASSTVSETQEDVPTSTDTGGSAAPQTSSASLLQTTSSLEPSSSSSSSSPSLSSPSTTFSSSPSATSPGSAATPTRDSSQLGSMSSSSSSPTPSEYAVPPSTTSDHTRPVVLTTSTESSSMSLEPSRTSSTMTWTSMSTSASSTSSDSAFHSAAVIHLVSTASMFGESAASTSISRRPAHASALSTISAPSTRSTASSSTLSLSASPEPSSTSASGSRLSVESASVSQESASTTPSSEAIASSGMHSHSASSTSETLLFSFSDVPSTSSSLGSTTSTLSAESASSTFDLSRLQAAQALAMTDDASTTTGNGSPTDVVVSTDAVSTAPSTSETSLFSLSDLPTTSSYLDSTTSALAAESTSAVFDLSRLQAAQALAMTSDDASTTTGTSSSTYSVYSTSTGTVSTASTTGTTSTLSTSTGQLAILRLHASHTSYTASSTTSMTDSASESATTTSSASSTSSSSSIGPLLNIASLTGVLGSTIGSSTLSLQSATSNTGSTFAAVTSGIALADLSSTVPLIPTSTVVRQGLEQTVVGYTNSAGFTPTQTQSSTASSSPSATETAASQKPVQIFGAVMAGILGIAIIAAIGSFVVKRRHIGLAILCCCGGRKEAALEELGFGPDYDPFRAGFKEQDKQFAAKQRAAEEGEQTQDITDANAAHQSPAITAYSPQVGGGSPNPGPTRAWAPLQPRKSILKRPNAAPDAGLGMQQQAGLVMWPRPLVMQQYATPGPDAEADNYTPAPIRRSRLSLIRLDTRDITDEAREHDEELPPPLPSTILDYYRGGEDENVIRFAETEDPFADFAPASNSEKAKSDDGEGPELAYMTPHLDGGNVKERPPFLTMLTQASSMYSDASHELPPVQVADTSMDSLKRAITDMSGFQVADEDERAVTQPAVLRTDSQESQTSSTGSMSSDGSDDLDGREGVHLDVPGVRKVLRERRKKSLALRSRNPSLARSLSNLSTLQRNVNNDD